MKLFSIGKDGGKESTVTGFWLCEFKSLFSIAFLRFGDGSRDAYHNHAFNSLSWVLKGKLEELNLGNETNIYKRSFKPIITLRRTFHKVISHGTTWVFTIRGPWSKTWKEFIPNTGKEITLTNGRKVV